MIEGFSPTWRTGTAFSVQIYKSKTKTINNRLRTMDDHVAVRVIDVIVNETGGDGDEVGGKL